LLFNTTILIRIQVPVKVLSFWNLNSLCSPFLALSTALFKYTEKGKNEIVKTTISIGIAKYDSNLDFVPEDLIKRADAALYRAKEGGRNRVAVAT